MPEDNIKSTSLFNKILWLGSFPDKDPKNLKKNIRESGAAVFFRDW